MSDRTENVIDLNEFEPFEAAAQVWADFMFPVEPAKSRLLQRRLAGAYIRERFPLESDAAVERQWVRPIYWLMSERAVAQGQKAHAQRLRVRFDAGLVALRFVEPATAHGGERKRPALSVNEAARFVHGLRGEAQLKAFLHRRWRTSRPVLHYAAAYASMVLDARNRSAPDPEPIDFVRSSERFTEWVRLARRCELLLGTSALAVRPESLIRYRIKSGTVSVA